MSSPSRYGANEASAAAGGRLAERAARPKLPALPDSRFPVQVIGRADSG